MKQESVSLACRETLRISASFADFPIGFRDGEQAFFCRISHHILVMSRA